MLTDNYPEDTKTAQLEGGLLHSSEHDEYSVKSVNVIPALRVASRPCGHDSRGWQRLEPRYNSMNSMGPKMQEIRAQKQAKDNVSVSQYPNTFHLHGGIYISMTSSSAPPPSPNRSFSLCPGNPLPAPNPILVLARLASTSPSSSAQSRMRCRPNK